MTVFVGLQPKSVNRAFVAERADVSTPVPQRIQNASASNYLSLAFALNGATHVVSGIIDKLSIRSV